MQKIIGMIGGVSWESTVLYYQLINQSIREKLGGLSSAKILIYSLNYAPIVELEQQNNWNEVGILLGNAAKTLQDAGADFLILGCNTLHKATASIEKSIQIPFLHIADAAGDALLNNQFKKVGLLGTQFTMEEGFYSSRLRDKFNLEVIVPHIADRKRMDDIIYKELCLGKILPASKIEMLLMIEKLHSDGAEAVLLGCTELGMIIKSKDTDVPVYDTTLLHAKKAVELHLSN